MNAKNGQLSVDLGGGRGCSFSKYKIPDIQAKIIAVDISEEELKLNTEVDETRLADIVGNLPFKDEEVDLVASRWVLEHVSNMDSFVTEAKRILKPGGYSVHLCASRFAPYAVLNRMLPNQLSKKILYFLGQRGFQHFNNSGFEAFYDKCYCSGLKSSFEKNGLEIIDIQVNYYQSEYFSFFLPLFLLSISYELILKTMDTRDLAAHILIVARKKR